MNKKIQNTVLSISIIVIVLCVGYIIHYVNTLESNEYIYTDIQESQAREEVKEPILVETKETQKTEDLEEEPTIDIPIDFDGLHEINPDVYAWIEIEGTEVAYPILQSSTDDTYYLNHTIDGTLGLPGSIYTETISGNSFDVFNTIIYGHNMNDDTMFGGLNLYRDKEYMLNHETITIYTEDAIRIYQIFIVTTFSDVHLAYAYNYHNESDCMSFLEDIMNYKDWNRVVRDDIEVTAKDRMITLSTCIGNMPSNRLLVGAVLIEEHRAK